MIAICRTALSLLLLLLGLTEPGPSAANSAESPAGTFLAGLVMDEQGVPVAGAEIQVTTTGQAAEEDEAVTAHSRAGGAFRIDGLEPGMLYRMITWKPGFVPRQDDDLDPSVLTGHRLALQRGRTASGRVVDAAGEPLAGAVLDLTQTSGYGNWIHPDVSPLEERLRRTRTGAAGTFSLPDLAPGAYELLILRPGIAPQRRALEVPSGKGSPGLRPDRDRRRRADREGHGPVRPPSRQRHHLAAPRERPARRPVGPGAEHPDGR